VTPSAVRSPAHRAAGAPGRRTLLTSAGLVVLLAGFAIFSLVYSNPLATT